MSRARTDTRRRILEATLALLEERGGKGVRMADIAARAGVTRQAVYLHFATRAQLLIAATRHLDEIKGADARLAPSRAAATGRERLDAFVAAWGGYLPEIHAVASALMDAAEEDEAAAEAWRERMQDMREGCAAAIEALARDGELAPEFSPAEATDLLWTMLSVRDWERLTGECGWPQRRYVENLTAAARRLFVAGGAARRARGGEGRLTPARPRRSASR